MGLDRGEIDAQLREIGEGDRWWEQREFRDLPHILHSDERILGLVTGSVPGRRRPRLRFGGPWLIVVTSQRLLCLRQERFARRQLEVQAGEIRRLHQNSRMRGHQITIETTERRLRIRIPKSDAFRFSAALAVLFPAPAAQPIDPDLEPLAWLPGISTVAALPGFSGIVSRVAMLSPPDFASREHVLRVEASVDTLQREVERLQQQVAFLEDLLQTRAEAALLPGMSPDELS